MTSPDGITWTSRTSASDIQWRSVCWSKELSLLVAVSQTGSGSRVMTSPDGITWTSRSTPEDIDYQSVCWSSELGLFVAVAGTGSNGRVITSLDGINWTLRSSILSYWNSVVWSPQLRLFVAVSQSGTRLMYSSNGINWSGISLDTFINYNSLCWSSELGLFIYVGERNSSATTLIATSSLNGRPPTSYNVFDSSFNSINQLGLWNFQSFGRGSPVTKTGDFVVQPGENWIVVNYSLATLITLPAASSWPGREIMIKTLQNSVISASSNVVPLGSTTPGTTLLSAGGKWCTIFLLYTTHYFQKKKKI